jgi:SAM-dependent methyltransferase
MEAQKRQQVEYHEREHYLPSQHRVVDNSHPYVEWLNNYRLRKAAEMMGASLRGKTVLSICGGDGEEAEFFHRCGAAVTVTDLSSVALQAARLRNPSLQCVCMDSESLTFPDKSFDWAIVRDGLHHLARPLKGLYELERVSREGFVILEGQDSLPVRILSVVGVAENWDPAGGYVYRFTRREITKIFAAMQTTADWKIHTTWLPFGGDLLGLVPPFRKFVYPVMTQPLIASVLGTRAAKVAFRTSFDIFTAVAGRWGNSLIIVAHKK